MELDEEPWLEILDRKHECGPSLSPFRPLDVTCDGRSVRVWVPDHPEPFERLAIKATLGSENLLVLIGKHSTKDNDPYERGILMVARKTDDGSYVVHVWHEMYPWALKYLGLEEES